MKDLPIAQEDMIWAIRRGMDDAIPWLSIYDLKDAISDGVHSAVYEFLSENPNALRPETEE